MSAIYKYLGCLLCLLWLLPLKVSATELSIQSVQLSGDKIKVTVYGDIQTDDRYYHLYLQKPNESGTKGEEVAKMPACKKSSIVVPVTYNDESILFDKFQIVIKKENTNWAVGYSQYITNPETKATKTTKHVNDGKKGIILEATMASGSEFKDLGISQISYNLPIGSLCNGNGVTYLYNNKSYTFNKTIVDQYDYLIPLMNKQGISVTMVLLNNWIGSDSLIHPDSKSDKSAYYYAFNTADEDAVEKLEAAASFLAERYSGGEYGTIDRWVIGNEINASDDWNYMDADVGIDKYVREYVKAFRIFYTAIKSTNAKANVYISLDHGWTYKDETNNYYSGKEIITKFAKRIKQEGDIDWGLAIHPYNAVMTDNNVVSGVKASDDVDTLYVSMKNINVVTDYMNTSDMLSSNKTCRSIICSEQGYCSGSNAQMQAASIVYAYQKAKSNADIDAFILAREQDHIDELAQGLTYGIIDSNGMYKIAYEWYKNADTKNIQEQAATVLGLNSISEK